MLDKRFPDFENTFGKSSINTDYVHGRKPDAKNFNTCIVTIRNPIDRMVSWFLCAHPKYNIIKRYNADHIDLCECYEEVNDLTFYGLERKMNSQLDHCQKIARGLMSGI